MTDSRFLDSSAWLSYFYKENEKIKFLIESEILLFTSSISIFEIKNKLIKDNIGIDKIQKSIEYIKKRSLIINLDSEIAENAVEFSINYKLPAIDSLIYSSALKNKSFLITLDNDFKNLKGIIIIS